MIKSRYKRQGVGTIEYGVIAVLVVISAISSVTLLGGNLKQSYCSLSESIGYADGSGSGVSDYCSTPQSVLQNGLSKLTQNLAYGEKNYIAAYDAMNKIIQQGKQYHKDCANGDQTACADYNTLVNGSPTADSWSSTADSAYNNALSNLNNAYDQLTWKGSNSLANSLNSLFSAEKDSGSTYQDLVQKYGETAANTDIDNFMQTNFTDPTTGQKTPFSSLFNMEQSSTSGWGVLNNGDAAISDFMAQYPKTIVDNINWSS